MNRFASYDESHRKVEEAWKAKLPLFRALLEEINVGVFRGEGSIVSEVQFRGFYQRPPAISDGQRNVTKPLLALLVLDRGFIGVRPSSESMCYIFGESFRGSCSWLGNSYFMSEDTLVNGLRLVLAKLFA